MLRAILFDMGGTLDGDGLHWLDRFAALYGAAGLLLPGPLVRHAFDEAERLAATDELIGAASLETMIDRHVGWQLDALGIDDAPLRRRVVEGFVDPVRRAATTNARVLADLAADGYRLAVVSNGCGNVDVLCEELGYRPFLSAVVDSRRVGLQKPDRAMFEYAMAAIGVTASATLMVGDSFDRDIRPAKRLGMATAWLEGATLRECPDPSAVDLRLARLSDLPGAIRAAERTVA